MTFSSTEAFKGIKPIDELELVEGEYYWVQDKDGDVEVVLFQSGIFFDRLSGTTPPTFYVKGAHIKRVF